MSKDVNGVPIVITKLARAAALSLATAASLASHARAETLTSRFPTFLHIGPGAQYAVSDEIPSQQALAVAGCQNEWCQVRFGAAYGWVRQTVLVAAPAPVVPAGRPVECFDYVRTGWPNGGNLNNLCIYPPKAGADGQPPLGSAAGPR